MKRNNKLVKFTTFALLITIVAISLVAGTYAKYTSTTSGSDTATVAKWSIGVSDKGEIAVAEAQTVKFDLFNTIKDSNGTDNETDVATGATGTTLIAPGTSGSFSFDITNNSEVTAEYDVTLTATNANNVPLEYSMDNGNTWKSTITEVKIENNTISFDTADNANKETVEVLWRWPFNGDDTSLGIAAQGTAPTVTVTATITVDQVD